MKTSFIDIDYSVTTAARGLISIFFAVSTYLGVGAHPHQYSFVFNYSLDTGRVLSLRDLFKPNAHYLKVISSYCINRLRQRAVGFDKWLQNGASDRRENYKSWNITLKGLLITFDPYQVASYAEGSQEVVVPYSTLKQIIRADSPLAPLIR